MKKLLMLIALVAVGCSSDDGGSNGSGEVTVLSYSKQVDEVLGGFVYKYTVSIDNTYDEMKSGDVVFKYQNGNTVRFDYVNDISIAANQTMSFTGDWNITVHQSDNVVPGEVYFVSE